MSQIGQGNIGFGSKTLPNGAPFPAGAAANGLSVDPITGKMVLGDSLGDFNSVFLDDRQISMDVFSLAFIDPLGARMFFLDAGPAREFLLGDVDNNGPFIGANAADGYVKIGNAGQELASFSPTNIILGNGSIAQPSFNISPGTIAVNVPATAGGPYVAQFYDTNARSFIIGDVTGAINGTRLEIDDTATTINLLAALGIATDNPGAGSGKWKLGTVIAAAVVLDATQFVETQIDGVTVKLAIVN